MRPHPRFHPANAYTLLLSLQAQIPTKIALPPLFCKSLDFFL